MTAAEQNAFDRIAKTLGARRKPQPSYFVVMIDYGNKGCEAIVDPEITREGVTARLRSGEYQNVRFIHFVSDGFVDDVTHELIDAAERMEVA